MADNPSEEQGIKKKPLDQGASEEEEGKLEMELNEKDEEVYDEEGRDQLVEDGEISPSEEAFMEGASGKGQTGTCAKCNKVLDQNPDDIVEKEIDGKHLYFCCPECREAYE